MQKNRLRYNERTLRAASWFSATPEVTDYPLPVGAILERLKKRLLCDRTIDREV